MWEGINESDLDEAGDFVADGTVSGSLLVCKKFELVEDEDRSVRRGRPSYYMHPKYEAKFVRFSQVEVFDNFREYKPFEHTPGLFRKFANLHKGDRSPETALKWANEHAPLRSNLAIFLSRHGFEQYGLDDPREYVDDFYEEVDRAATILSLYEAVLARDKESAWELVQRGPSAFARHYYEQYWNWEEEDEKHQDGILGFALHAVAFEVTRMVRTYASRGFFIPPGLALASRIKWGWNFDNLLGAMYLQMYWLLEAGEKNVTHCKACGKLIQLTAREPSSTDPSKRRKTRQDTQFCRNNGKCRQRYYYQTKEKHRRKAKKDD